MCVADPVTLLAVASAATSAYGAYNQAKAQQQSMNYQAQVNDRNAKVAEFQAQDAEARGQKESQIARQRASAMMGAQRASLAARGMDLTGGSAQGLLDDTQYFGELDHETIANNTAKEAWSIRARKDDYTAAAAMNRAGASNISPGLSLATSLVNSGASVANRWYRYKSADVPFGDGLSQGERRKIGVY